MSKKIKHETCENCKHYFGILKDIGREPCVLVYEKNKKQCIDLSEWGQKRKKMILGNY